MKRRVFVAGTAAVIAAPLAAGGQPSGKIYRLGILSPTRPPATGDVGIAAVLVPSALREIGYSEGRNLVIERRYADNRFDRLVPLATELVQRRMDVIFAVGNDAPGAARNVSKSIPIVMIGRDPVRLGYAASLARPGGNITGVVISDTGLADKRLQLLTEAVPSAKKVAVLAAADSGIKSQIQEAESAASSLGITLLRIDASNRDYAGAFATITAERAHAVFIPSSPILNSDRKTIIALAAKHRLPAMYQWREHVHEGGLIAYGSNLVLLARHIASYIDRIFKGASPAELPLEQPSGYELAINLKTARSLGLTIPPSLLVRADHVIE